MNWLTKLRDALFAESRYVRLLEEERARLLAEIERFRATISQLNKENRSLVNSLLGTAGVPPMSEDERGPQPHVPRRSWHQIQRVNERASERKLAERLKAEAESANEQAEAAGA